MRICAALILAASALHHPAAHAATTAAPDSRGPVIRFPFGVLAALVYITHEEYEYWFFRETDCRFAAQTHTWPDYGGVRHCVSKDGYLATWQNRGYDSKADISVYRLRDGGVTPVARYSDVEITNWERSAGEKATRSTSAAPTTTTKKTSPPTKHPSINA